MEDSDDASDDVPDEMDDVEDQGRVSIGAPHTPSSHKKSMSSPGQ